MGKFLLALALMIASLTVSAQGISIGVGPGGVSIGFDPGPGISFPPSSPGSQICFFQDVNYQGSSFCVRAGDQEANLIHTGWNDTISSVWIQGQATVELFQDVNYAGQRISFNQSVADIRSFGFFWNDLASSYVTHNDGPQPPPPSLGRACFYEGQNFTGESFCVRAGREKADLSRTRWEARISSVKLEGDVEVYLYDRTRFQGATLNLQRSVARLRRFDFDNRAYSLEVLELRGH